MAAAVSPPSRARRSRRASCRADRVPLLRQEHEVGAGRGGAVRAARPARVVRLVGRGVELDGRDAQGFGHAPKDSLGGWPGLPPRSSPARTRSPSSALRRSRTGRATASCATWARATTSSRCGRPAATRCSSIPCARTLAEIERRIDLVDVFRRPDACPNVARDAVAAGAGALWLQLGIVSAGGAGSRKRPGSTTSRTRARRSCTPPSLQPEPT